MDVPDVDRRWGATATKWVWSTQPRFVYEEDGAERAELEPVDEVLPEDYSDETGWWTCDPKTRMHDIAVVYRNAGAKDVEYPVRGPKDLCYVFLALSDAFPLADDPLAGRVCTAGAAPWTTTQGAPARRGTTATRRAT